MLCLKLLYKETLRVKSFCRVLLPILCLNKCFLAYGVLIRGMQQKFQALRISVNQTGVEQTAYSDLFTRCLVLGDSEFAFLPGSLC